MTYIVVTGNILDGSHFYGPFIDYWTAMAWADTEQVQDYIITTMEAPDATL